MRPVGVKMEGMTTRPPARGAGPWVAALLVLLVPVAYGAAYLAMLDPAGNHYQFVEFNGSFSILKRSPVYRIDNTHVEQFFAPAHAVDRWCRPNHWNDLSLPIKTSRPFVHMP